MQEKKKFIISLNKKKRELKSIIEHSYSPKIKQILHLLFHAYTHNYLLADIPSIICQKQWNNELNWEIWVLLKWKIINFPKYKKNVLGHEKNGMKECEKNWWWWLILWCADVPEKKNISLLKFHDRKLIRKFCLIFWVIH